MESTDRVYLNISAYKSFGNIESLCLCHASILGRYQKSKYKYNEQLIGMLNVENFFFAARRVPKNVYGNFNPRCKFYEFN